jgi:hypothetical protein
MYGSSEQNKKVEGNLGAIQRGIKYWTDTTIEKIFKHFDDGINLILTILIIIFAIVLLILLRQ